MKTNTEKISDTEAEVMKVIWRKNEPMTLAEIRATLNKKFDWGSQMVNTMINRLVQKDVLKQEKQGVYYYSALVTEADYMKAKTLSFVQKVYGGSGKGLLSALVDYEKVTEDDLDELRRFWEKGRDVDE